MEVTKADLINYRQLCIKLEDIDKTIKHLERDIQKLPKRKEPTEPPDKMFGSKVENLVVLKEIYENEYIAALKKRAEIEEWINTLPTEQEQNIVRFKYIHRLKYWQIADKMNYAVPHLKKLHRKIIERVKT